MRTRAGVVVLLLVAASCSKGQAASPAKSGSAAPSGVAASPSPPPRVITSSDGLLSVQIPQGEAENLAVTIEVTDVPPPDLGNVKIGGSFYELGPDGTVFDQPVTVTKTIDTEAAGVDLSQGIPVVVLLSRTSDGTWEYLGDLDEEVVDGKITVSGSLTHFSTVMALGGAATIQFMPDQIHARVRQTWAAVAGISSTSPDVDMVVNVTGTSGVVRVGVDPATDKSIPAEIAAPALGSGFGQATTETFLCIKEGSGTFGMGLEVRSVDLSDALLSLGGVEPTNVNVGVSGTATCSNAPGAFDQVQIAEGAVCTVHQPLEGGYPSYLLWVLIFSGLDPSAKGAKLKLTVGGGNGDKPEEAEIALDGSTTMEMGILSYGKKPIKDATVILADGTATNVTQEFIDYFGPAPEVTANQGSIGGQGECPVM